MKANQSGNTIVSIISSISSSSSLSSVDSNCVSLPPSSTSNTKTHNNYFLPCTKTISKNFKNVCQIIIVVYTSKCCNYEYFIGVSNGIEAVSDCDDGAVLEHRPYCVLNQLIRPEIQHGQVKLNRTLPIINPTL